VRRLVAGVVALLLLALLALGLALFAALDSSPLVDRSPTLSASAIGQARRLLAGNDPRQLRRGEERQVVIPAALIDEAANYLASHRLHGRGALLLSADATELRFSTRVPMLSTPRYLNVRLGIDDAGGQFRIASASIGRLPIPAALAAFALSSAAGHSAYADEWMLASNAIRGFSLAPARQAIVVNYAWQPAILDRARAIALRPDDLLRIEAAQTALAALIDQSPQRPTRALPSLLGPLLAAGGDHRREARRAALLVLATYLDDKDLAAIIPQARGWPRPRSVKLTLLDRHDSAQHFVISAALAAWAGEAVADAIGLDKEISDSRQGSGFSFADLAADRAGSRFGELVAGDGEGLDKVLKTPLTDRDLVPALSGLPEYLPEREFKRQYGGPGHPAYQRLLAEIDRRLAALPLYR
jgi:hypothetical protein